MTYHALGETSTVRRAAWCPVTSLRPGERDPCEIRYKFDLPLVGETEFGLPIPAMTNDALMKKINGAYATLKKRYEEAA